MEYIDLQIEIRPGEEGFELELREDGDRVVKQVWLPPWPEQEAGERLLAHSQQVEDFAVQPTDLCKAEELDTLQKALGAKLHASIFGARAGEELRRCLREANRRGEQGRPCGVRLRFIIDPDEPKTAPLLAMPWELIHAPEEGDAYARYPHTPILRYIEAPRDRKKTLRIRGSELRVLLVSASPKDEAVGPIDVVPAQAAIREALAEGSGIHAMICMQPTLSQLHQYLDEQRPHIVYLLAHGSFDPETGKGMVGLVDPEEGLDRVRAYRLAESFKGAQELRLVILATCSGGAQRRHGHQDPFSNIAPALVRAGIPAVLAMQFSVSQIAARVFSKALLASLLDGEPIDTATAAAREAIYHDSRCKLEWATPVLFSRSNDGRILSIAAGDEDSGTTSPSTGSVLATGHLPDDRSLSLQPEGTRPNGQAKGEGKAPLRIGIRTFATGWGKDVPKWVDSMLKLEDNFLPASRYRLIHEQGLWNEEVRPEIFKSLDRAADERRPLEIYLPCHPSIAFTAGYCLQTRSGLDITLHQRPYKGEFIAWNGDGSSAGPSWIFEESILGPEGGVALAISCTVPIRDDVEAFLQSRPPEARVSRVLWAEIDGGPKPTAIKSGAHALRLAHELCERLRRRSIAERRESLSIFTGAPNGLLFFLGQLAPTLGNIQTFEYPFGIGRVGEYQAAITLPPPMS